MSQKLNKETDVMPSGLDLDTGDALEEQLARENAKLGLNPEDLWKDDGKGMHSRADIDAGDVFEEQLARENAKLGLNPEDLWRDDGKGVPSALELDTGEAFEDQFARENADPRLNSEGIFERLSEEKARSRKQSGDIKRMTDKFKKRKFFDLSEPKERPHYPEFRKRSNRI